MSLDTVRVFAISELAWIRRQQRKLQEQECGTPREYLDRESHYAWGRRYLLTLIEGDQPASVGPSHSRMILRVRPETGQDRRQALVEAWYRERLKAVVPPVICRWRPLLGVNWMGLIAALAAALLSLDSAVQGRSAAL